jgi:hypothetical protein
MNAAHCENAPAIVVRGISDMCAGKDHEGDKLHQPIAAAHAAAFAFSILSFRSKVRAPDGLMMDDEPKQPAAAQPTAADDSNPEERRIDFVFNFEGSKDEWTQEKVESVVERLKQAIDDEKMTLVSIDVGSVRLVMSVRQNDLAAMDFAKLREAAANIGATLLGAMPLEMVHGAEKAKEGQLSP